ncbi:hypothetical protein ACFJGX_12655 [Hydrogenophaga sp. UC242_50]|uniref:hypothetical protein n=1 Tax=Hydrogenophaga sp. UC242_50 TaxID=3350169 RepID=UPI0036D2D5F4
MNNNDNPDTMPTDEPTRWEITQTEDVFLPSVRVQLGWRDVEAAVESGAIQPAEAHALWASWASPGSPLRVAAGASPSPSVVPTAAELAQEDLAAGWAAPPAQAPRPALDRGPAFSFTNTLYYFGGMLAIGAMTLFMTLGWELFGAWGVFVLALGYLTGALLVAGNLLEKGLRTPAGVLATLAVCLVPLAVWAFQSGIGLWPEGGPDSYRDYHRYIDWRWLTLELATLAAAVVLLYRYKLPFMVMPVAVTIWYLSMDVAHMLMQKDGFDWTFTRDVSLVFGLRSLRHRGVGGPAHAHRRQRRRPAGLRLLALPVRRDHVLGRPQPARQRFRAQQVPVRADQRVPGVSRRGHRAARVHRAGRHRRAPATWATWPTACSRTACCSRSRSPCWAWGWWRWASGGSATKTASTPGWPTGCRQH